MTWHMLSYASDFSYGVECRHCEGAPSMDRCVVPYGGSGAGGMAWASESWACRRRCVVPCTCDVYYLQGMQGHRQGSGPTGTAQGRVHVGEAVIASVVGAM